MINRKYIEENQRLYLLFMIGAIFIVMCNYAAVFYGIEVFMFERLTIKVYEYSTNLYLLAKVVILITAGLLFLEYTSRKSFDLESNKVGLLLAALIFVVALFFLITYLFSSTLAVNYIRLSLEASSFLILMVSLHFFLRFVNSLDFEDNAPTSDILKPIANNTVSNYSIEIVEPKKRMIYFHNLFVSLLLIGGPGAGKTASIIKPLILCCLRSKNESMIMYDPKSPELTRVVIAELAKQGRLDKLKVIDLFNGFHKVNPIDPSYLEHDEVVIEIGNVLADNFDLGKGDSAKFWRDNFVQYITGVILFLKYEFPEYCTLPHVVSIMKDPRITTIISMCETVPQAGTNLDGLKKAIGYKIDKDDENSIGGSQNQTSGILGTVATALSKIDTQKVFYTFNGNDFNLKINELENQQYVSIGNYSQFEDSFKAPLALIFATVLRLNNVDATKGENRIPLSVIMDEFNTIKVEKINRLPALGRSRLIQSIFATQDYSLIDQDYGKVGKEILTSSCGNVIIGNNGNEETLLKAANMIGKRDMLKKTNSKSKSNSNYNDSENKGHSKSEQEKYVIKPHEIAEFKPGEFVAKMANSKQTFIKFRAKYEEYPEQEYNDNYKGKYDKSTVMWLNYIGVKMDAFQLISDYEIKLKAAENPAESGILQSEKSFNY